MLSTFYCLCFKQWIDGFFLNGCLRTLNKLKKLIAILLTLGKSKNSCFAHFGQVKKYFADFGQVKKLLLRWLLLAFSLCKTPLVETGYLSNPYFLLTGSLNICFFDSLPFPNKVIHATSGYLLLNVQHLCDLRDTYQARDQWHFPPNFYHKCYRFEKAFFNLRCFLPCTPSCCFQGFPGTGSLTSKVAGLHADLQNIVPARL